MYKRRYFVSGILACILLATGFLVYNKLHSDKSNDAQKIINKVSKLIELPADETPTVATVTNPGLLNTQPFFSRAKEGDKVLIYTKSTKAFLYRPSLNRLIEVSAIITDVKP